MSLHCHTQVHSVKFTLQPAVGGSSARSSPAPQQLLPAGCRLGCRPAETLCATSAAIPDRPALSHLRLRVQVGVEATFSRQGGALLSLDRRGSCLPERWELSGHREWEAGLLFPACSLQRNSSGVQQYQVLAASVCTASQQAARSMLASAAVAAAAGGSAGGGSAGVTAGVTPTATAKVYSCPPNPALPPGSRFLPDHPPAVPAWRTRSGHLLVAAALDGTPCRMLLDSGASGFVIEPAFAERLGSGQGGGLPAFGQLAVVGVQGSLASRFRRAQTFQLGPLVLEAPLMMEMSCRLPGLPDEVAGIVG